MIGHLRGRLLWKSPQDAVVDAGGVGYRVTIPVSTFYKLGDEGAEVSLYVHTHVREDALALYGFATTPEQRIFERLIAVAGVGPRLAVNILSGIDVGDLVHALRANDVARLTRVPGVGRKTAERLVVELKDKLAVFSPEPEPAAVVVASPKEDLLSALANLGYSRPEAERAVDRVLLAEPSARFEDHLRATLRALAGR